MDHFVEMPDCLPSGHRLEQPFLTVDGEMVAYCEVCGCRAAMPWVRGGTMVTRVRWLVSHLNSAQGVAFDSVSEKLAEAIEQLHQDRAAVDETLDLARVMLERTYGRSDG
jgi:hypothetical protein